MRFMRCPIPINKQNVLMNELPGSSDNKWVIYWEREYSTAFAPERLKLDFHPHRPMMTGMILDEQRNLAASGYKVIPDDCGPG